MSASQSASRRPVDPHVLVVEDEPRMRELLQRVLGGWGLEVTAARSAEEGWRFAEAAPPDVVVLDLNLPGEAGIEFFRRVRGRWPNTQGIVLTGFASIGAAREAIHLDVVEFLTKPCHLGELEKALDRAIRRLVPTQPIASGTPTRPPDPSAGKTLEDVEREHILAALSRNAGNRTATATELGISRRTLYYKLEGYQRLGYPVE
jgi:DNA-binding NtrC family response regulator